MKKSVYQEVRKPAGEDHEAEMKRAIVSDLFGKKPSLKNDELSAAMTPDMDYDEELKRIARLKR